VVLGAHRALAASASDLAVATLEDAVGERSRPNLPGTVDEHPNWRQALRVPIEGLDDAGAAAIAAVMRDERGH
ncbi:MAG: 4-alpha-glucanotransferase, partial [Microthrixaceae bacterium]